MLNLMVYSYLYSIAPPHSLLIEGWDDSPWQYKDYEKYTCGSLYDATSGCCHPTQMSVKLFDILRVEGIHILI